VRSLVDDLNEIGKDPSFYMTAARDAYIAQLRAEAEQLNRDLYHVKCAILANIDIQCAEPSAMNL